MKSSKTPWKDRSDLLLDIHSFIRRNGGFFKQYSKRMSDLFEMSIFNDVVRFYKRKKYIIQAHQLGKDRTFYYKLSPSGLVENFSFFSAEKKFGIGDKSHLEKINIHHNIKIQSAHNPHIYYTADVSVCHTDGAITDMQHNGKRHSFILNSKLVTFFEAKNMNPFPEVLFSFSGLVLEVMPGFIFKQISFGPNLGHLCPSIVFSGLPSEYAERVARDLEGRYGFNVIYGLFRTKGKIYSFNNLNEKRL